MPREVRLQYLHKCRHLFLSNTPEWQALLEHKSRLEHQHLRDIFAADPDRFKDFSLELDDLLVDFSKQRFDAAALAALVALAKSTKIEAWRDRMFAGEKINFSEDRAVLHTALRHSAFTQRRSVAMTGPGVN